MPFLTAVVASTVIWLLGLRAVPRHMILSAAVIARAGILLPWLRAFPRLMIFGAAIEASAVEIVGASTFTISVVIMISGKSSLFAILAMELL